MFLNTLAKRKNNTKFDLQFFCAFNESRVGTLLLLSFIKMLQAKADLNGYTAKGAGHYS